MKMSALAEATGVPVATIKYYLREGLVPAGTALSRTQADYGQAHVERVHLIRTLSEVGGLDLATIRRVFDVLDGPEVGWLEVVGTAQRSLAGPDFPAVEWPDPDVELPPSRAREWVERRGWRVGPLDPALTDLDDAWEACDRVGLGLTPERLDAYADAAELIAEVDVSTVPADVQGALRQAVLGTVLIEPVLAALRRLAQQNVAVRLTGLLEANRAPADAAVPPSPVDENR